MTVSPRRVVANRLPLQVIKGEAHGRKRRHSYGNTPLNSLRKIYGPTQCLHPANGAADDSVQPFYTKMVKQPRLRSDDVSDRHEGKIAAVKLSRLLGLRAAWSRRPIARPDDIHANDTVLRGIKGLIRPNQLRPPVRDA